MEAEAMDISVALVPHTMPSAAVDGIRQAPAQPGPAGQGASAIVARLGT